jgi:hypothetical protein
MESKGDVDDEDDENNSLWMTSTQFSQLLDKQETLENMGYTLVNKKKKSKQQQQQENKVRNLLVFWGSSKMTSDKGEGQTGNSGKHGLQFSHQKEKR